MCDRPFAQDDGVLLVPEPEALTGMYVGGLHTMGVRWRMAGERTCMIWEVHFHTSGFGQALLIQDQGGH
jgi:hypothetical protein